eukprot:TRINITY_DN8971_c0_g1_i4.p1 TRINITY_DN8971_c0_g1~~TRINITY_DN8971_c0_g1_i4.p1  ORF type:complete len:162 (+),score=26.15 TRINITY_DN8971_c0_g1_i4:304-789(+)
MWDVDHTVCNTNCAYRTNGDWCEWTSMCHWVESSIAGNYTGYCRSECQYLPDMNSTSCAAKYTREDTCTWDTIRSHCYATCPDLTNSSRCESNVVCKWVGTVCMNDCSQYSTANCLNHGDNLSLIHISEPTRLLSISYAVFCLKKKKNIFCQIQSNIVINE